MCGDVRTSTDTPPPPLSTPYSITRAFSPGSSCGVGQLAMLVLIRPEPTSISAPTFPLKEADCLREAISANKLPYRPRHRNSVSLCKEHPPPKHTHTHTNTWTNSTCKREQNYIRISWTLKLISTSACETAPNCVCVCLLWDVFYQWLDVDWILGTHPCCTSIHTAGESRGWRLINIL